MGRVRNVFDRGPLIQDVTLKTETHALREFDMGKGTLMDA